MYITRLASKEIFSQSNKIQREVGRAKDLSAPLYWEYLWSFRFSQRCCWRFSFDKLHCIVVGVIPEVSKGHSDYIFIVFLDCVTLKMKAIHSSETLGSIRVSFHKTCILREAAWSVVPKRREHETFALHSGRFRCLLNHYTDLTSLSFACPTTIRNILITIIYIRTSQYHSWKHVKLTL